VGSHSASLGGGRQAAKNAFDRLTAAGLLLLFAPLMLAIALAVHLEDGGPALSRQLRVGRHNRTFRRYLFRTASGDGDRARDPLAPGGLLTAEENPGLTRTGAWLLRWSLNGLPQLVNVLLGHMSLVGPRAILPAEAMKRSDHARWRLDVRPGITGLWLVHWHPDLPPAEAFRLDLRYVEGWSFALDMRILWKTWSAATHGRGAQETGVCPPAGASQPL
jgi:lipopolysaccharide/colanic/teichoic acid biosynthesis glycosyltransferase